MEFNEGMNLNYRMEQSIRKLLENILKNNLTSTSQAIFLAKMIKSQIKAAKRRQLNEAEGLHIPAFMIASITHQCNLNCAGCYANVKHKKHSTETDFKRLKSLVGEARDLGISIILLAGGEPLVRKNEILDIAKTYNDTIFPIFTNGTLIDEELIGKFKSIKNIIPIISIEGFENETDSRRGVGIYRKTRELYKNLRKNEIFFGCSITVTSDNIETVTNKKFIEDLISDGCKLFFFVEYVPVEAGTERLILSDNDQQLLMQRVALLRQNYPVSFIAFPGDEEQFGGCIASGRGFIHISPEGDVEPCPFAPFSDSNLKDKTLRECIQSQFLKKIRENHELLVENQGGGCALWQNRELVKSYLNNEI